jgi:hypothetical protein
LGPLPIDQPERLAVLWQTDLKKGVQTIELSSREYDAWRAHLTSFSGMAAVTAANIRNTLTGNPEPEQVESAIVLPELLSRPRRAPAARARLRRAGCARHGWLDRPRQRRAVDAPVRPGSIAHRADDHRRRHAVTVVGVMPVGTLPRHADLFLNGTALAHDAPDLGVLKLVGRLEAGASLDAARAKSIWWPRGSPPSVRTRSGRRPRRAFTDQITARSAPRSSC